MGLASGDVADQIGINEAWYSDLEDQAGEMESSLDLAQIHKLAVVLETTPYYLILGGNPDAEVRPMTFQDLKTQIEMHMTVNGVSREQMEELTGWELTGFLHNPQEGWNHYIAFFQDICRVLDLDWRGLLISYV